MILLVLIPLALLALILGIFLCLVMPRVGDRADMDLLCTDYAHRGLWDTKIPENSMAAFANALRHGYGIELDIRLTKDSKLVVFHDDDLRRMCGIDKRVRELTLSELRGLTLRGTKEPIPTLAEVLALVDGAVPLLIEIKGDGTEHAICRRAVSLLDGYRGAFAIEAFDPRILAWFKSHRPRYARGQLVTRLHAGKTPGAPQSKLTCFALSHMLLNVLSRPDFIAIDGKELSSLSFRLPTLLFRPTVFVWTVRTTGQYRLCRSHSYFTIFEGLRP